MTRRAPTTDPAATIADTRERLLADGVILCIRLTDGSGVVVWGPRHIVLVGLEAANVVWALELPGHGRQLANDTSYVSVVGGTLATLTRRQRDDASWVVEAHFIDVVVGNIIGRRKLLEASEMPVGVRRFPRGETERLVFRHHVFELSPPASPEYP